jgi:hypothetical protein
MKFWKFLKNLYLPIAEADYYSARLALKADLAWQPYLHTTVWWGVVLTFIFGDPRFLPPGDGLDWIWVIGGLTAPILGVTAVWRMKNGTPKQKYRAFWMRLASDMGLWSTMMAFEIQRLCVLPFTPPCTKQPCPNGDGWQPFADLIIMGAIIFVSVLIYRDIRFLKITERLADTLRGPDGNA